MIATRNPRPELVEAAARVAWGRERFERLRGEVIGDVEGWESS